MKINEVEAQVGITKKNIRFYEEQGLLSPRRNSENGYRDYGEGEVAVLRQIKLMRKLGVPLEEIRRMQAGGTVADGMRRHLVTLERERSSLEQSILLCQSLKNREERLDALDAAALHCMLRELARQENLTPDPDVATQVDKQYAAMVVQAGSDESRVIHTLWTQMLTRDLLINLNENTELFSQLAELYYGENSGHYPTDAEVNAYLDEVGRYKAKHILLATIDLDTREPLDEATVAQKKAQAEDFLAQLRAAEDPIALFDDLMNEHSEDSGLATNPDGYTTVKGEMVAPFEEAALALKAGEISEVVESDFGYHIILRLPLDPDDFRDDCVTSLMEKRIDQEIERLGLEKTAAFDKLNVGDFWDKLQSLQYAVQIEMAS